MMPFVRSLAFKCCTCTVAVILLFSEIMPSCSRYKEKKLVYVVIVVFFSRQLSSYIKCTKLNMHLSYNIKLVSNTKYL